MSVIGLLLMTLLLLIFLEQSIEESIHRCESPVTEGIHWTSPSTVDPCTSDEESQDEMMVDPPIHLSPK